jgi:hypothetical protein
LGCPYAEIWLPDYFRREASRWSWPRVTGPRDLIFCFVDHYEPHVGKVDDGTARRRLEAWMSQYARIAARHRDSNGRIPGHSFFYPYDEMEPSELRDLAAFCAAGFGELEIHLHHLDDTSEGLREKLRAAVESWRAAGALGCWRRNEQPAFGFIHGNWALDNSRVEHGRNFCGVNDEITILAEEGCYADFTFPALCQMTQPRQANSIYYAADDPLRPKSHNHGVPVRSGEPATGDLIVIQGPLCLRRQAGRLLPRAEDGDVTGDKLPTPERVDAWVRANICLPGQPGWVFVKVHTHGATDRNLSALLGGGFDDLFNDLEQRYNNGRDWRLHYVTAREMFNIVKAAEVGLSGNPDDYRDFAVTPPDAIRSARARRGLATEAAPICER